MIARKYVVINRFVGDPKKSDFEIVEYELPRLQEQEILVKVEWISVDPYLRAHKTTYNIPYDQYGYQVGVVYRTRNKRYPVGTRVVSHQGWCTYCIFNPQEVVMSRYFGIPHQCASKLMDGLKGLPASLGVGALGFPGAAAYFGFLRLCRPRYGHNVVVTTAAGGVGTIVGQIAKIKGCTVIGFTGSDAKVKWLKEDLDFDYAFNYKTVNVTKVLRDAAPDGIDSFFDNVGGELSYAILRQMKDFGRVAICGCISFQNRIKSDKTRFPNVLQPIILEKQLRVEGFIAFRWYILWENAFIEMLKWIQDGDLKVREHVTEGFDNTVDAFLGMLAGENYGKAVVKV